MPLIRISRIHFAFHAYIERVQRSALAIGPVDQASPLLGRDQAGGGARLARVRATKLVNASSAADLAIGLLSKPTPLLGRDQAGGGARLARA